MRIDVHHYVHLASSELDAALQPIRNQLQLVIERGEFMNETLEAIKAQNGVVIAQNQSLQQSFTGLSADVNALKQRIEDLTNAGGGATQAELESLLADVTATADAVTATAQSFAALDSETTQDPPPGA